MNHYGKLATTSTLSPSPKKKIFEEWKKKVKKGMNEKLSDNKNNKEINTVIIRV